MKIIIIGNGIAGVTAARTLRGKDPEVEIEIFTDEKYYYYPRPNLINFLANQVEIDKIYMYPPEWYREKNIKVHLNKKVVKLIPAEKVIELEDGSNVNYGKLLLAMGCNPFLPPIRGAEKKGVFTLRTLQDAIEIKKYSQSAEKAIVIGGGLLGLESAKALKALGLKITVVEFFPRLLPRQLDTQGAEILQSQIESTGLKILCGEATEEIIGSEKTSGILLKSKKKIEGDLILMAAGVRANIKLAQEAGIKTNRGVIINEYLETNIEDIYAAGDITEFKGRVYGIIPAALDQSKIAGMNLLGREKIVYQGTTSSNTLKVVGIDLTSIGQVNPEGDEYQEIKKVDLNKGIYKKIVLKEGRIVGAIFLGDKKGINSISQLINEKIPVEKYKDQILEDDFDFKIIKNKIFNPKRS
ncbi:MAG: NAD(P)/FAD-dependent oxidoreductase [Candidatus Aminicenantia bacterium]